MRDEKGERPFSLPPSSLRVALSQSARRATSGSDWRASVRLWRGFQTSRRFPRNLLARGLRHARIHVGVSWVSPAMAAFRLSRDLPIGSPVAGSPTASRYSRWPWACPVSPSAVERNTAATRHSENADIGLRCEIQITAIGLRFAGKRRFQITFRFRSFELHGFLLSFKCLNGRAGTENRPNLICELSIITVFRMSNGVIRDRNIFSASRMDIDLRQAGAPRATSACASCASISRNVPAISLV